MLPNIIKQWKLRHAVPFSEAEVRILAAALRWFGHDTERWAIVSRLFLPHRSPQLLRIEFENILCDPEKADYLATLMLDFAEPD